MFRHELEVAVDEVDGHAAVVGVERHLLAVDVHRLAVGGPVHRDRTRTVPGDLDVQVVVRAVIFEVGQMRRTVARVVGVVAATGIGPSGSLLVQAVQDVAHDRVPTCRSGSPTGR